MTVGESELLIFQPSPQPLVPFRAPEGYSFADARPVVITPDGAQDGNEIDGPWQPAVYVGQLHTVRRSPHVVPIPAVVATWQDSEDAAP